MSTKPTIKLTKILLNRFKEMGITYKSGRAFGSIFIKYQNREYRIHKQNAVHCKAKNIKRYKFIYYCKKRKNGNKMCGARITIIQTEPESSYPLEVHFEGSHRGDCSLTQMDSQNPMDFMVDEDGSISSSSGCFSSSASSAYSRNSQYSGYGMIGGMPLPPLDNVYRNVQNQNVYREPQSQQRSVLRPPVIHQPPPPILQQNQASQHVPQQRYPQQQQQTRQTERLPHLSEMLEEEEEDNVFNFGINSDDYAFPSFIESFDDSGKSSQKKKSGTSSSFLPFPYAGGSSCLKERTGDIIESISSPKTPPPNQPRKSIFKSPNFNNQQNQVTENHPLQNQKAQKPPMTMNLRLIQNCISAVVPREGPITGGNFVRVFCNCGFQNQTVIPNIQVRFGQYFGTVISVAPSFVVRNEIGSKNHWQKADTFILCIAPASGEDQRVDVFVIINNKVCSISPSSYKYLKNKIGDTTYEEDFNLSGYYGA